MLLIRFKDTVSKLFLFWYTCIYEYVYLNTFVWDNYERMNIVNIDEDIA